MWILGVEIGLPLGGKTVPREEDPQHHHSHEELPILTASWSRGSFLFVSLKDDSLLTALYHVQKVRPLSTWKKAKKRKIYSFPIRNEVHGVLPRRKYAWWPHRSKQLQLGHIGRRSSAFHSPHSKDQHHWSSYLWPHNKIQKKFPTWRENQRLFIFIC